MERLLGYTTLRVRLYALASLGALVVLSGCGADNSYKNTLRPPEPINVTANVSTKRVSVSPTGFGAGPKPVGDTDTRLVDTLAVTLIGSGGRSVFLAGVGPAATGATSAPRLASARGAPEASCNRATLHPGM